MKKSIFVILSCAMAMVLVLGSCKSKTENEAGKSETTECAKKVTTMEEAVTAMEEACKDGNKEAVKSSFETMTRLLYDKMIENLKAGKDMEESIISKDLEKRMEAIEGNCDCVSDEEMTEISEKIQKEYEPKMEEALNQMLGGAIEAMGEMNEAAE